VIFVWLTIVWAMIHSAIRLGIYLKDEDATGTLAKAITLGLSLAAIYQMNHR
jgi:hypothetical protein